MATPEDYELVARRLDGENVPLTPQQQALAEEITADAERVGPALDVAAPPGLLHRVNARTPGRRAALAPAKLRFRWAAASLAAAGLLAVITVSMLTERKPDGQRPSKVAISPATYVEQFIRTPAGDLDARAEILASELADYQVQLALGEAGPADWGIRGLEDQVREFIFGGFDSFGQTLVDPW